MKYTVLGATGFIGRNLASALRCAGHEVFAPARDASTLFEQPLGHVLYCIGLTADFRSKPFETVRAHVSVLTDVLERADFESLVYLSSTRVYGRSAVATEQSLLAIDPADPSDLYNISKLAGESLCLSCNRPGVKIARLSNVIGQDANSENFVFALIREALAGRIELMSDPGSAKDYILLDDVLAVLPLIAATGTARIYNVASGVNLRHQQIIERLVAITGCDLNIQADAPLLSFPPIDVTRIQSEFDFYPASVLDEIPSLVADFSLPRHGLSPN